MPWIDVTVPVRAGMHVFEGDPPFRSELFAAMARGDVCNVTRLDMGAHTGTHIDAPMHFIDGAGGADSIDLEACIGPAWVVDARAIAGCITAADLERLRIPGAETRLLFRTTNSELWRRPAFQEGFVGLDASAAAALAARGVRLVGIDYLSIAPFGDPTPTHRALLERRVVIVEGLDLAAVEPGPVELVCLPVRLVGSDGAPARVVVRRR